MIRFAFCFCLMTVFGAGAAVAQQMPCKSSYRAGEPVPAHCRDSINSRGGWSNWGDSRSTVATTPNPTTDNSPVLPDEWKRRFNQR